MSRKLRMLPDGPDEWSGFSNTGRNPRSHPYYTLVMMRLVEPLTGLLALLGAVLLRLETAPGMNALAFGVLSPLTLLVSVGFQA